MRFVLLARVLPLALALILCASSAFAGPSSLVATAVSSSQISLKWSGSTQGWTNYAIERSLAPTTGFVKVGNVSRSTSYTNGSLTAGTTYYYRVREMSRGGVTNIASATTLGGPTNKQPVANAGPDQLTQSGVSVTFNGSGSYDPDGTISTYSWNFGDGGAGSGKVVSHAYSNGGTYTALLTVKDNGGLTGSDSAKVSVVVASTTMVPTTSTSSTTTLPGDPTGGGDVLWAARLGGAWNDNGYAVAADKSGAVVIAGKLGGPADLGGGLICRDFFVRKYSAAGVPVWTHCAGALWVGSATGYAIAADPAGDVIVTGEMIGSVDFGGGSLAGDGDLFVAKLSGVDGAHKWSRVSVSSVGNMEGRGLAVDPRDGSVVVTGVLGGTADVGGGYLTSTGADVFLSKYSAAGNHVWSKVLYGSGQDHGVGVAVERNGNIAVTGWGDGPQLNFGGGTVSIGGRSAFVAKYTPDGRYIWARTFSGTLGSDGRGVAVDDTGAVVVTGSFRGTITFGGASFSSVINPTWNAPSDDGFIAKLSATGAHVWSRAFGGTAELETGNAVAVDARGDAMLTGLASSNPLNLGGGPLGGNGLFLAKYGAAGQHLWSQRFMPSAAGLGVAADADGGCAVVGRFRYNGDFGTGPLTNAGGEDVFVARVAP